MHFIQAKQILSSGNGTGMNVYRGCEHGCIYCDSRSACYQINHPFEDIAVKQNAPALLEDVLSRKRTRCMIGTGSMCDPYMPLEKNMCITQRCLEIIDTYRFGAAIQTKSDLVLRDLALLQRINMHSKAVVQMTLTTYDETLCRLIEPAVCTTRRRYETLCAFRDAGVPTVVWLSPILPFINDSMENLEGIMNYCIDAGVVGIICFGFGVTLREGSRDYFYAMLDKHFPGMKKRYQAAFGMSYEVTSPNNVALMRRFTELCRAHSIMYRPNDVFSYLHTYKDSYAQDLPIQGELF